MKKNIKVIEEKLDSLEKESQNILVKGRNERAKLSAKLEELERKQKEPSSLDEYKEVCQEIRDTRSYLDYLNRTEDKAKHGILSAEEMKDIRDTIQSDVKDIQNTYAPDIQKKFSELIEMMDKYTAEVIIYEALINRATRLHCPNGYGSVPNYCSDIAELEPDKLGYWSKFVYMYYCNYDTAQKAKRDSDRGVWAKKR